MQKTRKIQLQLEQYLSKPDKKIIFLWGPRQTGKSTILQALKDKFGGSYFNFDEVTDRRLWTPNLQALKSAITLRSQSPSHYVFIDEVQNHPSSTLALKLLADAGEYTIVATGSSELRAKTQAFDTLAGRYHEFVLFPLTLDEFAYFKTDHQQFITSPNPAETIYLSDFINEILFFGSYPKITLSTNKVTELKLLTRDSVIKDIVNIYELKNTDLVYDLLRLLSTQIGNLINLTELASSLSTSLPTLKNYLSILVKNRIIYLLEPYKSSKRRGYLERRKVYFYDLGIRNALIEDFRPWELRTDLGACFENLVVMGALRQTLYQNTNQKLYFFREIGGSQKEIDLIVEDVDGKRVGYEIKYHNGKVNRLDDLNLTQFVLINHENASTYLT